MLEKAIEEISAILSELKSEEVHVQIDSKHVKYIDYPEVALSILKTFRELYREVKPFTKHVEVYIADILSACPHTVIGIDVDLENNVTVTLTYRIFPRFETLEGNLELLPIYVKVWSRSEKEPLFTLSGEQEKIADLFYKMKIKIPKYSRVFGVHFSVEKGRIEPLVVYFACKVFKIDEGKWYTFYISRKGASLSKTVLQEISELSLGGIERRSPMAVQITRRAIDKLAEALNQSNC